MTALTQTISKVFSANLPQYPVLESGATIAASKDSDTTSAASAKKSNLAFLRQAAPAPKADASGSPQNVDVMAALLQMIQMLATLESDLVKANDEEMQRQATIGGDTVKITHNISVTQEKEIQDAAAAAEKAEKQAKIMQIVGYVVTGLAVILSAFGGAGALLMTVAMTALTQTGTMDKALGNLSPGAKLGISLAIGLAAGGLAAGIDAGVASASKSGAAVAADEAGGSSKTVSDQAYASFKFSGLTVSSQLLIQLHPIQDLLENAFGKDSTIALALTAAITIVMSVAAAYYAGAGAATDMSPNVARACRFAGVMMVGSSIVQGALQIWQGTTLLDQAAIEKKRAYTDPELELIKSVNQVVQSQYQQTSSLNNNVLKEFGTDFQNTSTIYLPWDAAARALSGAA